MASAPAPTPPAAPTSVTRSIAVVTTGLRADVLQHVALARALVFLGGFRVKFVSHAPFAAVAAAHGLEFAPLKGDPSAVVATSAFRGALDTPGAALAAGALLSREADSVLEVNAASIAAACKGMDALICSIAVLTECLAVGQRYQRPVLLAPLLPYAPSGEVPLAQLLPRPSEWAFINRLSYDMSGALLWAAAGSKLNRFRSTVLGLGPQAGYVLEGIPQVAAFSPAAIPRPADWGSYVVQTGTWVLPLPASPASPLLAALLLEAATLPPLKRPIVVAFEGTPCTDTPAFLRALHRVATRAGLTAVFCAGEGAGGSGVQGGEWAALSRSPRMADLHGTVWDLEGMGGGGGPPPRLLIISTAPYALLFACASTVVHHGGAAVTQAAWASGVPSVAFPGWGDQWFWAARTCAAGVSGSPAVFPFRDAAVRLEECAGAARGEAAVTAAAALGKSMRACGDGVTAAVAAVRAVLSRPQSRHAGIECKWEADESRSSCSVCSTPFTMINRRRHCRSCGRLACGACVMGRCHLPGFGADSPQVCCAKCIEGRRSFFSLKVGEAALPPLPAGTALSLGAQGGAGELGSPIAGLGIVGSPVGGGGAGRAAAAAALLSPGSAAALADGFDSVDLLAQAL